MIYNIHEQYFIDSMLKEKQILTNDSYLIDFNNVVNGNVPIQNKKRRFKYNKTTKIIIFIIVATRLLFISYLYISSIN